MLTESIINISSNNAYLNQSLNETYNGIGQDVGEPTNDQYLIPIFEFEHSIYLHATGILVIITLLINFVVIAILLKKEMRSVTNLILAAISISDSLKILVTVPFYIIFQLSKYNKHGGITDMDMYVYSVSESFCQGFLICTHFLSRSVHTISNWLTLFLGIQRYLSVANPFRASFWFTTRNTIIIIITITVLSPVSHIYHLFKKKTRHGWCVWFLDREIGDYVYLWMNIALHYLLPCTLLPLVTILFVKHMRTYFVSERNTTSGRVTSGQEVRANENRRISKIVMAILIVFLMAEGPFTIYYLWSMLVWQTNSKYMIGSKRDRAIYAGYEIVLIVSYQMNFYIYTFLNKRFRQQLKRMFSRLVNACGIRPTHLFRLALEMLEQNTGSREIEIRHNS